MARRWLLTILAGTAISVASAGAASAQTLGEPLVLDAEVATVTVTSDTATRTLEAEVATDLTVDEAETVVAPTVEATVSPDGPDVDVDGEVEVAGTELPITQVAEQVVEPVEEVVEPAAPVPGPAPTQDKAAAGGGIAPAPAPAAVPAARPAGEASTTRHSSPMTADRAAYRAGLRTGTTDVSFDEVSVLDPEVAPPADALPLVAAAAPTIAADLSLPVIDATPTVPALLRLLAGLLVVGAAATWRTVRDELA